MIASYGPYWVKRDTVVIPPPLPNVTGARIFLGENPNAGGVTVGAPVTARDKFVSNLTSYYVDNIESYTYLDTNPTLTFGGSGITATTTSVRVDNDTTFGRFNTTPASDLPLDPFGDPQLGQWLNLDITKLTTLTFSTPIAAFGFYGTDMGDWAAKAYVKLTESDGSVYEVPLRNTLYGGINTLLFFGVIRPSATITSITVYGTNIAGDGDYFGMDDIIIATAAQVNIVTDSYPSPWPTNWVDSILETHFNTVSSGNLFEDASDLLVTLTDSVADSVASGTWTATSKFGAGAYQNLNGAFITVGSSNTPEYRAHLDDDFTLEGFVKLTGARVGTGHLIYWSNNFELTITAAGKMQALLFINAPGTGSTSVTLVSTTTLPVNTSFVHWSVMRMSKFNDFNDTYFEQYMLFIDGVPEAGTTRSSTTAPAAFGITDGVLQIGAKNSTNYTPCILDDLRFSTFARSSLQLINMGSGAVIQPFTPYTVEFKRLAHV